MAEPAKKTEPDAELPEEEVKDAAPEQPPEETAEPEKAVEPEEPQAEEPEEKDVLDDPGTDRAVDDIIRKESDKLLEVEDEMVGTKTKPVKRGFFSRWWHNKPARWTTILIVVLSIAAVFIIPTSRYWVLNSLGVRVSASVRVIDDTTGLALKGVEVTVGPHSSLTDAQGKAEVKDLELGPHELTIEQPGFDGVEQKVTLGLGSNPLGEFSLVAVGMQYTLNVTDFLTGKPLVAVQVMSGDATALTDRNGKAVITMPGSQTEDVVVRVVRDGFRVEEVTIKALTKEPTPVALVTTQRAVYVSHENGTYDVMSSDADGQNKKLVLAGTGNEGPNIALAVSPDGKRAALVSTRENKRDADGFLLSTLTLINLEDLSTTILGQAAQLQLVDWRGSRLVFEQVSSDAKSPAGSRYTIISYDYSDSTRLQLASSEHFNSVVAAQGIVFYAITAPEGSEGVDPGFYRVNADGTNKLAVLDKEVWSVYRTDYNTLSLQTPEGWYTYNVSTNSTNQVNTPSSFVSRGYADRSDGKQSLWIDNSGGGVLLRYERSSGKDTAVQTQAGMAYPVRWLTDDTAIYRVVSGGEVADYVASTLDGYPPRKIADVVNTFGFSQGN